MNRTQLHMLTGGWDSVRFIGLFGLLVHFTMHNFTGEWDCVPFIGLFGLFHYAHFLWTVFAMDSGIVSSLLVYLVYY